ncbi:Gfo/Idh/MocA family oxidoreductase [Candidatus Pelagibacter sp.]|nr:Gfo/Idh/MocA family oxidoreductase [Candidatus Pelagibacter sp.]
MNILIIGLGSIGQRHLRNLKIIEPKSNFYAIKSNREKSAPLLNNFNQVLNGDIKKKYSLTYFKSIYEIYKNNIKIDCAFVCTPSSKHISQVIELLKYNIHCFIEKPLGSSSKQLSELESLLKKKKKLITMMGFQLRFNPLIEYLNKVIKKKSPIGKLLSANIHHGENIKDFHPYEDYRISYAANKKLGGGVILTQIHEIDYFLHLFSNYKIKNAAYISSKISDLDIDVEDIFSSNFLLKKNKNKMFCNINLNYFERPKKRKFYLIGSSGTLVACFNTQKINITKNGKEKILKFNFKKNDIFIKEIKFFISKVKSKKLISKDLNLYNGIKTLRFALKLKSRFIE